VSLGKRKVQSYPSTEAATTALTEILRPGDLVLIKGSRAMAMERIVQRLTKDVEKGKAKG
jgi:UDP-N-acetylmuramyl pentapeptide synthase